MRTALLAAVILVTAPASFAQPSPETTEFWNRISALCGQAFEGEVAVRLPGPDTTFVGQRLVMHVRQCSDRMIRIPFHVGNDHSRTWVLTWTDDGIRLKHDHRHADGSEDRVTWYGGDTATSGTASTQEFPADEYTAQLLPAASTNVWTMIIEPGQTFSYALRREGTDRRLRVDFDLTQPVARPRAPWGF
ncbi:hypothetical protein BH23BAC4_BH23BAC4_04730 [soil metagenome]